MIGLELARCIQMCGVRGQELAEHILMMLNS